MHPLIVNSSPRFSAVFALYDKRDSKDSALKPFVLPEGRIQAKQIQYPVDIMIDRLSDFLKTLPFFDKRQNELPRETFEVISGKKQGTGNPSQPDYILLTNQDQDTVSSADSLTPGKHWTVELTGDDLTYCYKVTNPAQDEMKASKREGYYRDYWVTEPSSIALAFQQTADKIYQEDKQKFPQNATVPLILPLYPERTPPNLAFWVSHHLKPAINEYRISFTLPHESPEKGDAILSTYTITTDGKIQLDRDYSFKFEELIPQAENVIQATQQWLAMGEERPQAFVLKEEQGQWVLDVEGSYALAAQKSADSSATHGQAHTSFSLLG